MAELDRLWRRRSIAYETRALSFNHASESKADGSSDGIAGLAFTASSRW